MSRYWCELAWIDDRVEPGVLIDVDGSRIGSVSRDVATAPADATRLAGLTMPGLANAHSHAFHRALRGRTHSGAGSFWTWREQMYAVAGRLTPDTYHRLARATYAEMAMAGIAVVGEFHYVHHQPDGSRYDEPNAMGEALLAAADDAGIRITLLDTLYLHGGLGADGYLELSADQVRFGDGDANRWAERVDGLRPSPEAKVGAAVHSVRAVDPEAMVEVQQWAQGHGAPVHVHLSEQPTENDQAMAAHGRSPAALVAEAGLLGPMLTAVHATHLTEADVSLLGSSGTGVCLCPTTERDLADGVGPASALASAGSPLSLGSDSHAVIDLFEEARAVELNERLTSHQRGLHTPAQLLAMATGNGHRSLGWPDAGELAVGRIADLVTVDLGSVRLAGADPASVPGAVVFAATAADVDHVVVGGRVVVRDGAHTSIDVPSELKASTAAVGP